MEDNCAWKEMKEVLYEAIERVRADNDNGPRWSELNYYLQVIEDVVSLGVDSQIKEWDADDIIGGFLDIVERFERGMWQEEFAENEAIPNFVFLDFARRG